MLPVYISPISIKTSATNQEMNAEKKNQPSDRNPSSL